MRFRAIFMVLFFCAPLFGPVIWGGGAAAPGSPLALPVYDYVLIDQYPHDPEAFTQGLYYKDGYLYEGTGIYGESSLRKVVPETGNVVKIHYLPAAYFGEGITIRNDVIHQLTWHNYTIFRYVELDTFAMVDSFPYVYAGWGLTHDDTSLIATNGGARLYHLDPETYEELSFVPVTVEGILFGGMNEMELIQGRVWANIYGLDSIAVIVPETGVVESWIDLTGLRDLIEWGGVLNGIAFDEANYRLFVTGKQWPAMFEIWVDAVNYPPEITSSSPPPSLCLETDSTVVLSVSADDPNYNDTLDYIWSINGVVDPVAHDSFYIYSSPVPAVDTIRVEVNDGMLSDSTWWLAIVATAGAERDPAPGGAILRPLRIQPNPFRSGTVIGFNVPRGTDSAETVEVAIYDIRGRMMRTLLAADLEPGDHETAWDGTDNGGRRVAAGIYLCTVRVAGATVSKKLAVLD